MKKASNKKDGVLADKKEINFLELSYPQALFLLKIVFAHIFRVLEAVSTGYVYAADEHLNAFYITLTDNLEGLLQRKDFEELRLNVPPDLPKHLYQDIDEMDVWWEHSGQPRMTSFMGDVESARVRAGQQTLLLPDWLAKYFEAVNSAVAGHKEHKAEQWNHIAKNLEERTERGKFSFEPSQSATKKHGEPEDKERILKLEITSMPELIVRNAEESTITKGKKRIRLPKFKPTDWSKITIRFLDERNVLIETDKKEQVPSDFEALGFADERRGKPNLAWTFFYGLALNNGETQPLQTPIPDNVKQQKRQLSDRLKTIFKNDTDPFYDPTDSRTYKIKINLIPPQTEDAERDNLGTREYLKDVMTEKYDGEYNER